MIAWCIASTGLSLFLAWRLWRIRRAIRVARTMAKRTRGLLVEIERQAKYIEQLEVERAFNESRTPGRVVPLAG